MAPKIPGMFQILIFNPNSLLQCLAYHRYLINSSWIIEMVKIRLLQLEHMHTCYGHDAIITLKKIIILYLVHNQIFPVDSQMSYLVGLLNWHPNKLDPNSINVRFGCHITEVSSKFRAALCFTNFSPVLLIYYKSQFNCPWECCIFCKFPPSSII